MSLSVVLPCYNEAKSLPLLLARYAKASAELSFELILVNNGSTDNTKEVISQLLKNPIYEFVKVVPVQKNQGYGYGLMAGLKAAQGNFLAYSHADMQCAPEDVFLAFKKLVSQKNPQKILLKGKRQGRGFSERTITFFMGLIATIVLGKKLSDINAQPKVFHRSLLAYLQGAPSGFEFDLFVLYQAKKNGWRIETIPVQFSKRMFGQSHWNISFLAKWKTICKTLAYIFKLKFQNL